MKRTNLMLILLLTFLFASVILTMYFNFGKSNGDVKSQRQHASLWAQLDIVDMGTIREGTAAEAEFVLCNGSDREITVLSSRSDCGCVVIGDTALKTAFASGEKRAIKTLLDTKGMHGLFKKRVFISYKEGDAVDALILSIEGRVAAEVYVKPRMPDFKQVSHGYKYGLSVEVGSDVTPKFTVTAVTVTDNSSESAGGTPISSQLDFDIAKTDEGIFEIKYWLTPAPTLSTGTAKSTVQLSGLSVPSIPVILSWEVLPIVNVSPCAIVGQAEDEFVGRIQLTPGKEGASLPAFTATTDMSNAKLFLTEETRFRRVYTITVRKSASQEDTSAGYVILDFEDPDRDFPSEEIAVVVTWQK